MTKSFARQDYGPVLGSNQAPGQLSPFALLDVLWRRWILICVITLSVVFAGIVYLISTPARYTATTSLVIDTKRVQLFRDELLPEGNVDQASIDSQLETIRSQKVAKVVVDHLNLTEDPEFSPGSGGVMASIKGALGGGTTISEEAATRWAIAVLRSGVRVARVGRSYTVEISYTSRDPWKAARIANAVAEAYIVDQADAKTHASQRASAWLQQRIGDVRDQASNAFRAVQEFKSENNIIDSNGKLNTERELDDLTSSLARARAETSQTQARLERIQSVLKGSGQERAGIPDPAVTDVLNNPVILRLRQQFLDAQNRESDFSARYGKNHGAVVNLRTEMAGLQRAIWEEVQRIAETYKSEFEIARSREQSLDNRVKEVFQQGTTGRQAQVRLRELETSATTYRQIYENFLNRYSQAVQQESFPSPEARVINEASYGAQTSPKSDLTLVLSVLAGLGLGVGAAFAREYLDRVIRARSQLETTLGVTCLGVIPFSGERPRGVNILRNQLNQRPMLRAVAEKSPLRSVVERWLPREDRGRVAPPPACQPLVLLNADEPFSVEAETLRSIKVAIDLHGIARETRVIGIVSALPGEGKTTIAANLALTIAQSGRRTLLIDGDLRNPSLTRELAPDLRNGLLNVLSGRATLETSVNIEGSRQFQFLAGPSGTRPVHTADILGSAAMQRLLEAARKQYDYVIVDLPPMLPVVDVRAAAHLIDTFVLVTAWGSTTTDQVEQALRTSSLVCDRLLGFVLNKADPKMMRRFEGYQGRRYGYSYGYGTDQS